MDIKLSICIPTYNRAKYLPDLLESILTQINKDNENLIEIVISDNASTDNTIEVINKYKNKFKNLVYFKWDKNMGADRNFLKVVELANGEYCWFMGSDDVLINKSIPKLLLEINNSDDISMFLFNRINADINLIPFQKEKWLRLKNNFIFDFSKNSDLNYYLDSSSSLGALFSYISSICVKKELWNKYLDLSFNYIGTAYVHVGVIFNIIKHGHKLKYINEYLVLNRGGNDSFLSKGWVNRSIIDFKGYYELSLIFNNFNVKNKIFSIIRKNYPFYRLIKISYYSLVEKKYIEFIRDAIKVKFNLFILLLSFLCALFFPFLILLKHYIFDKLRKRIFKIINNNYE